MPRIFRCAHIVCAGIQLFYGAPTQEVSQHQVDALVYMPTWRLRRSWEAWRELSLQPFLMREVALSRIYNLPANLINSMDMALRRFIRDECANIETLLFIPYRPRARRIPDRKRNVFLKYSRVYTQDKDLTDARCEYITCRDISLVQEPGNLPFV